MKTNVNLIGLWVNLSRAYEIAKLGGYSIKIIYNPEYVEAKDDYNHIKEFYSDVDFSESGTMVVEITKPEASQYSGKIKHETIEDINKRIAQASNIKPVEYTHNPVSENLLKVATERLNFSLTDIEFIKSIACTIAQMDLKDQVRVEHVAEAIQYRAIRMTDLFIVAGNDSINFGSGIEISLAELNDSDIEAAIKYLTGRL